MDKLLKQLESFTSIPPRGSEQFDVYLENKIEEYYDLLKTFSHPLNSEDILQMKNLGIRCVEAVNKAMSGQPHEAYDRLTIGLKMSLYRKEVKSSYNLYRMRSMEEKKGLKVGDLFHVPFTIQGQVTTQRYSVPGLPCLYLGLSLYGCWEELLQPAINSCVFSRLQSVESFYVLDLRPPKSDAKEDEKKNFLRIMPLIIACSIQVQNKDDVFKPEYIIPQLMLQVIPKINESKQDGDPEIIGYGYRSVHQNSRFGFPKNKFDNIVVPAQRTNYKFDPSLCELFQLTQPSCEEYERIRSGSSFNMNKQGVVNTDLSPEQKYEMSLFGQLEARINNDKLFPLQTVENEIISSN